MMRGTMARKGTWCHAAAGPFTDRLRLVAAIAGVGLALTLVGPRAAHSQGLENACPADEMSTGQFEDTRGNTHEEAIDCIVVYEITFGVGEDRYEPSGVVTRAQMASFIARAIEPTTAELPSASEQGFSDVSGGSHESAINQLAAAGIVQGTSASTYSPGLPVRRDQMATFLVRVFEFITEGELSAPSSGFTDVEGNAHEENIDKAAEAGFASGTSSSTFSPATDVRRDQMASFLARMLDRLVQAGTLAPPHNVAYLDRTDEVDDHGLSSGSQQVDATNYARSVYFWMDRHDDTEFASYDLARSYERFRAVVGISDDSEPNTAAQFDVFADGEQIASEQVGFGETAEIDVDVTDALRLRIETTNIDGEGNMVWANARMLRDAAHDLPDAYSSPPDVPPEPYLGQIDEVDDHGLSSGSQQVDATNYARSVYFWMDRHDDTEFASYDLARSYERFRAVVGISDDSEPNTAAQFDVFADGEQIASEQVGFGETAEIDVDVTDALRLRIETTNIDGEGNMVWGDAQIIQ